MRIHHQDTLARPTALLQRACRHSCMPGGYQGWKNVGMSAAGEPSLERAYLAYALVQSVSWCSRRLRMPARVSLKPARCHSPDAKPLNGFFSSKRFIKCVSMSVKSGWLNIVRCTCDVCGDGLKLSCALALPMQLIFPTSVLPYFKPCFSASKTSSAGSRVLLHSFRFRGRDDRSSHATVWPRRSHRVRWRRYIKNCGASDSAALKVIPFFLGHGQGETLFFFEKRKKVKAGYCG
jgi:hypothetical protein